MPKELHNKIKGSSGIGCKALKKFIGIRFQKIMLQKIFLGFTCQSCIVFIIKKDIRKMTAIEARRAPKTLNPKIEVLALIK